MLVLTNITYIFLSHFFLQQGRPNAPSHTALPEPQVLDRYLGKISQLIQQEKMGEIADRNQNGCMGSEPFNISKRTVCKNYDLFGAHNKFSFAYKSLA